MAPKFGQLDRTPRLPTRVASLISKEITENRLKPGDRLPTEQALAATFGVGRNVIREAIARLKSDGIVESKQGVGAFVGLPENQSAIRIDFQELKDKKSLLHLFELRRVLEVNAAEMAAINRSEQHLIQMSATFQKMSLANEESIDADLEFHRIIAQASGNPYFLTFVSYIGAQVAASIRTAHTYREDNSSTIFEIVMKEHNAIFEAIKEKNPQKARESMQQHLLNAESYLGLKTQDQLETQ